MNEKKKKIRILYLTWGEVIVKSGIFRNQVVQQLMLTARSADDFEVSLLSGIPLVNLKLLKSPRSFYKELWSVREKLSKEGIRFDWAMIPVVSSWFYAKTWQFPWFRIFNMGYFRRLVKKKEIDVVHCRSYHATYFALLARRAYGLKYKVIFDTRGLFPEEGIVKKSYESGNRDFLNSKKIEQFCLDNADAVVNVSGTFTTYIQSLTRNKEVHTIFTSTNLELFGRDDQLGAETRGTLGISSSAKVLVYLGDVRNSGWHQASNLARLFKSFALTFPESLLLVITEQDHEGLIANMSKLGVNGDTLRVRSGTNQGRINALLNAADFACLPFRDVKNEIDRLLGYTMIASKTGEYLAAGLPILCNAGVGAASDLVRKARLGTVYSDEAGEIVFENMEWADGKQSEGIRTRAVQTAGELFDAKGNARRYAEIYRTLSCSLS